MQPFFARSQTCSVHLSSDLSFPCVFVIDRAYLPREELPQSAAYYGYHQQMVALCVVLCYVSIVRKNSVYVCAHTHGGAKYPAPCLLYLVWRVVVLQNKRPWVEALFLEWAVVFIYIWVYRQWLLKQPQRSPWQHFSLLSHPVLLHRINTLVLKVRVWYYDLLMSHCSHTADYHWHCTSHLFFLFFQRIF